MFWISLILSKIGLTMVRLLVQPLQPEESDEERRRAAAAVVVIGVSSHEMAASGYLQLFATSRERT